MSRRYRKPLAPLVRDAVFARDGEACVRCGSTDRLTIDHVVPTSKGGTDALDNLRVLCHGCNSAKGPREDLPASPDVLVASRRRLAVVKARFDVAHADYIGALEQARRDGVSFAELGRVLGVSRQAVRQFVVRSSKGGS